MIVSPSGDVLSTDLVGRVIMRSFLTGMPVCKFGLNDKLMLENLQNKSGKQSTKASIELADFKFHQCVNLNEFETEKDINFVPPDGEFELMSYHVARDIKLPFKVRAMVVETGEHKVEYKVSIKALYPASLHAQNIIAFIPAPLNTSKTRVQTNKGKAKYQGSENGFIWKYI